MKRLYKIVCFSMVMFSSIFGATLDVSKLELITKQETMNREQFLENKKLDLKFVTTWCSKCRKETSKEFIDSSEDKYIYIFGEYGIDSKEKVIKFLKENPQVKPAYFDHGNILKSSFEISRAPTIIPKEDYEKINLEERR